MQLDLISPQNAEPVRLAAKGRISAMNLAGTGNNPIAELLGPEWSSKTVLVDMSKSDYIDSSAIGWLLHANTEFNRGGGKLVLHSIPPMVKQMLMLLKIGSLIPLRDDEAAAKAYLNGEAQ